MQKLIVKHFGPIEYAEIEIKDLMIFIGPQASGKSTLAKLVYFYRKANEMLFWIHTESDLEEYELDYAHFLTIELNEIFNLQHYEEKQYLVNEKTELLLIYGKHSISIKYIDELVFFDVTFNDKIFLLFDQLNTSFLQNKDGNKEELDRILGKFNPNQYLEEPIYIPAGRILFSTFAEDLLSIKFQHLNNLEFFIKEYVNEANIQKQNARLTHQDSILAAKKKNKTDENQSYFAEIAQEIIEHKILKGKYQYKDATEKLFFEKEKFIPFRYASSGQQEVNWIASCLFSMILKNESRFLVIEEPEAHLYPTGQKAIVELMGLTLNATKSPILLTTHSPYILTAFDNLIQAKEVSKLGNVDTETLAKEIDIPQACWIDFERVGVFYMADGKVEDIMDYERKAIGANKIDDVSEELGRVFDTLLHYKYKDA